ETERKNADDRQRWIETRMRADCEQANQGSEHHEPSLDHVRNPFGSAWIGRAFHTRGSNSSAQFIGGSAPEMPAGRRGRTVSEVNPFSQKGLRLTCTLPPASTRKGNRRRRVPERPPVVKPKRGHGEPPRRENAPASLQGSGEAIAVRI